MLASLSRLAPKLASLVGHPRLFRGLGQFRVDVSLSQEQKHLWLLLFHWAAGAEEGLRYTLRDQSEDKFGPNMT